MKILKAKFGYIYHNKSTDTYSPIIYLPDDADLSIFEEVPREDIDFELYDNINKLGDITELVQISSIEHEELLNITMMALDELFITFEPLLKLLK